MVSVHTKSSIIYDPVLIILSLANSDFAEEYILPLKLKQFYQIIRLPKKRIIHGWLCANNLFLQYRDFLTKATPTNLTSNINCSNPKDIVASLLLPSLIITTSTCIYSLTKYNSCVSLTFPKITTCFKRTTHRNTHLFTEFTGLDPRSQFYPNCNLYPRAYI